MNKKSVFFLVASIAFFSIIIVSCDNSDSGDDVQIQDLREAQLINTYDNGIAPLNIDFQIQARELTSSISELVEVTNSDNLLNAQKSWMDLITVWKRLELYNIGLIEDSFIHFEINRWPSDLENIENYISGDDTVDVDFLKSKGSSSKGVSAIEYLLFDPAGNSAALNSLLNPLDGTRRLDYILAASQILEEKSQEIANLWNAYENDFKANLENSIDGSHNQLTNAMVALVQEIVISKLGKPLGEKDGGVIQLDKVEAGYSNHSIYIIKKHLEVLKNCYEGDFIPGGEQIGFDDYLNAIDQSDIDSAILSSFSKCENTLSAMSDNLVAELGNSPTQVEELQNNFEELLTLIKVDMANALGVIIVPNDSDGD
jgi:predicted lipoprotein